MDDFNLGNLNEARNEWAARLLNYLTPSIIEGFRSIFSDALELCIENEENEKYLMTFQNFLSRIPKWNNELIQTEVKRIQDHCNCTYLQDLITCVHIIQLKALTSIRVGQKHKKIDIDMPKLDLFIHNCYISLARKIYKNIYLFEIDLSPLEKQKNNRELELIAKESILNVIRESIPIETILKAYLEETTEEDLEQTKETIVNTTNDSLATDTPNVDKIIDSTNDQNNNTLTLLDEPKSKPLKLNNFPEPIKLDIKELSSTTATAIKDDINTGVKFSDIDNAISIDKLEEKIHAPKTIDRLEQIAEERAVQRKLEEEEEENNDKIKILDDITDSIKLTSPPPILNDIIAL